MDVDILLYVIFQIENFVFNVSSWKLQIGSRVTAGKEESGARRQI
jgi:hypothetical protein